jgi:hypothetical protein
MPSDASQQSGSWLEASKVNASGIAAPDMNAADAHWFQTGYRHLQTGFSGDGDHHP